MLALLNVTAYNQKAPYDGNAQSALAGQPALGLDLHKTKNVLKAQFAFSATVAATGTYLLFDDVGNPAVIPAKALIQRAYIDCYTAFTGSGASVAFSSGVSAADLKAATAVASLTGLVDGIPVGTMATSIKVGAAAVQMSAVVSGAALTAGAANIFVEYVLSN